MSSSSVFVTMRPTKFNCFLILKSPMEKLWKRVFPALFQLACDVEQVRLDWILIDKPRPLKELEASYTGHILLTCLLYNAFYFEMYVFFQEERRKTCHGYLIQGAENCISAALPLHFQLLEGCS